MSVAPFEQKLTDRWKVVEHPSALPGECFLCRGASTSRRWFVDLAMDIEFHGRAYLCDECLAEIAETTGYLIPEHVMRLKAHAEALEQENYKLRAQVAAFHEMEKAIGVFVDRSGNWSDRPAPDSDDHRSDGLAPGNSTEDTSGGADRVGEGEGTSPEPQHDEGVDDIRSDDNGDVPDFSLQL